MSLKKYFAVWPQAGSRDVPEVMTRHDLETDVRYKQGTSVERFVLELLFRVMRNEDRVICKAEIDLIKQRFLFSDCNNREYE